MKKSRYKTTPQQIRSRGKWLELQTVPQQEHDQVIAQAKKNGLIYRQTTAAGIPVLYVECQGISAPELQKMGFNSMYDYYHAITQEPSADRLRAMFERMSKDQKKGFWLWLLDREGISPEGVRIFELLY